MQIENLKKYAMFGDGDMMCVNVQSDTKDKIQCYIKFEEAEKLIKQLTNIATDSMRRFDDVDIEALSDRDMAWTARIIVREYRAALARIARQK